MLRCFFWIYVVGKVYSEVLPPPQDVHIDSLLKWSSAPEYNNVTYTVQYLSYGSQRWRDVSACVQTNRTSCDVAVTKAKERHGCVALRVRTKKHDLTSTPVEACNKMGDSCSPSFNLTSRPGFLTVHLSRNHSLVVLHGDHAKCRIYYGKEGENLQIFRDATSSESIQDLEEGMCYCVKVQFIYHSKLLGPPGCTQCIIIPESGVRKKKAELILSVVMAVVSVLVLMAIAYKIIFKYKIIKKCLEPLHQIPENLLQPFPEGHHPLSSCPSMENFDRLSLFSENKSAQDM